MRSSYLLTVIVSVTAVTASPFEIFERSTVNGACTGKDNVSGVCIATGDCTKDGGVYVSNKCPGTADNIKCCTKPKCGSGGSCKWSDKCDQKTNSLVTGQCPGPTTFKCCVPKSSGGTPPSNQGPYKKPTIPSEKSGCQKVAIKGVEAIIAQFPGHVREIGCIRKCDCPSPSSGKEPSSDHCCGKANDLMCSKAAGVKTQSGQEMAEWIMNNYKKLNVKYVMWGQKIWTASRDKNPMPWSKWRYQSPKDRGDNTANHWDHVHVSYN